MPALGESVTEATVAKWLKKVGDAVEADEPLLELETDKVTLEVNAPAAGTLAEITAPEGSDGRDRRRARPDHRRRRAAAAPAKPAPRRGAAARCAGARPPPAAPAAAPVAGRRRPLSPAVRKMVAENNVDPAAVAGTGKDGRLTKGDVTAHLAKPRGAADSPAPQRARRRVRRRSLTSRTCRAR